MKAKKISLHSIEETILKVTTHPLFLTGVGLALNASAYRKLVQRKIFQSALSLLELPNRSQVDKTLYLLSQMESRLSKLESNIHNATPSNLSVPKTDKQRRPYNEDATL